MKLLILLALLISNNAFAAKWSLKMVDESTGTSTTFTPDKASSFMFPIHKSGWKCGLYPEDLENGSFIFRNLSCVYGEAEVTAVGNCVAMQVLRLSEASTNRIITIYLQCKE